MHIRTVSFLAPLIPAVLLVVAVACAPIAAQSESPAKDGATAAENTALPAPSTPELAVEPGTTEVTATWGPVDGATSYQVRWRQQRGDFGENSLTTATDPTATFDVGEQGLWVVRVVACNDEGCGPGGTTTAPVIINIYGRQALRIWHEFDAEEREKGNWVPTATHLDWDPLPGYYVVKYRLTNNQNWVTSEPLSEVGYTLTAESYEMFENPGSPRFRVFFNCTAAGERCTLLGRLPDDKVQTVDSAYIPPHARNTPGGLSWTNIHIPTPEPGATGAGGSDTAPRLERDPLTHMLRPASDFTITTETREDGITYRCVSRAAETPWERGMFGDASDALKSCTGGRTLDRYRFDPDAVFPDGATCGERPAENDLDRATYGDMVKVCNAHPDLDADDGDDDDADQGAAPSDGPTGQTHTVTEHVDAFGLLTWPNRYVRSNRGLTDCISREQREPDRYSSWDYETWVRAAWCYYWRHQVTLTRTLEERTGSDDISFAEYLLLGLGGFTQPWQSCGWKAGYAASDPYEVVWQYQPDGTTAREHRRDWGYTSEVIAEYGNVAFTHGYAGYLECEIIHFTNHAGIIIDWEGQHGPWPNQ